MAVMVPSKIPQAVLADPKRAAEVQVYRTLETRLPNEYVVIYSVAYQLRERSEQPRDGEADFVIAHERDGLLVIEVKGGQVRLDGPEQQWYSRDRYGVSHPIKDPFVQARNSHYGLRRKLRESPQTSGFNYPSGYAVCFPNSRVSAQDIRLDAPRATVIDCDDLDRVDERVSEIYRYWALPGSQVRTGKTGVQALIRLIGPSWEFQSPLHLAIPAAQQQMDEYTEQQFMLLDQMQRFPRLLIAGCAGSGKTFLAAEKARRLANEGFSVALVCWNENLGRWLQKRLHDHDVDVHHYNQFARSLVWRGRKLGAHTPDRQVPTVADLQEALRAGIPYYDAIIVDEGQDFYNEQWEFLQTALRSDGMLYVFYDDNQRIYTSQQPFPIQEPPVVLTVNCRNTREIHELAMGYYVSGHQTGCLLGSGRRPEFLVAAPDEKSVLANQLSRLVVHEGLSTDQIVILTPCTESRSKWVEGCAVGGFSITRSLFRPKSNERTILCSSIGAFKGLERDVIILTELDQLGTPPNSERSLYIALSRARHHLIVIMPEKGWPKDAEAHLPDGSSKGKRAPRQ